MDISDYIQANYGRCTKDKCQCVNDRDLQMTCSHYEAVVADDWEKMIELAKELYSGK